MSFTEPTGDAAPEAPAEATPEPQNVREAIAIMQAQGPPEFVDVDAAPEAGEEATPEAAAAGAVESSPVAPTATAAADPYAEFGGRAQVEQALALANGLKTEAGLRLVVGQGLQRLGKTPEVIEAFMKGEISQAQAEATPATSVVDDLQDDDVVTGADLKSYRERIIAEAQEAARAAADEATKPLLTQAEEARNQRAATTVDSTLVELLGTDGDPSTVSVPLADQVRAAAGQYLGEDDWSEAGIRSALIRGHADVVAWHEQAQADYLAGKRTVAAAQPTTIGGGATPGSEPIEAPKTLKEASARAKEMGFFE